MCVCVLVSGKKSIRQQGQDIRKKVATTRKQTTQQNEGINNITDKI